MVSKSTLKCSLLWKLCRRHGWSSPVSEDGLTDLALEDGNQGDGREIAEELIEEPYIGYVNGQGYFVKNDPDSQAQAAYRLINHCGYLEIQVESTLSRFEQAGGFDAYDEEEVMDGLDNWE